jgi:transposase
MLTSITDAPGRRSHYHIVRDQVPFRELGPDWQRKRHSAEHRARRLQRQLQTLG